MQEKKNVELKRWRKEVREKKCPALICRKKFWRVLIEESDTLGAAATGLPFSRASSIPRRHMENLWECLGLSH